MILAAGVLLIMACYYFAPSMIMRLYSPRKPREITVNTRIGDKVEIHGVNASYDVEVIDADNSGPTILVLKQGDDKDSASFMIYPGERGQPFEVNYSTDKNGIHTFLTGLDGEGIATLKSVRRSGADTVYRRGAIEWMKLEKKPNQSSEPALSAVTPHAGQESRPR